MVIQVRLLPDLTVNESASHAAKVCYTTSIPKLFAGTFDVFKKLFAPSHHTTLQHAATYETFEFDGVAVGDVTEGFHLTSPFYNTDQRSGRYASKMFENPNFDNILAYIERSWPDLPCDTCMCIRSYLQDCASTYSALMPLATKKAKVLLKEDRPYISEKMLEANAPKVAQEQVRMFIPVIFPTAMVFTVNLTALIALYEEAWTPGMKDVTDKMVQLYVEKHPDTAKYFDTVKRRQDSFTITLPTLQQVAVAYDPRVEWADVFLPDLFVRPEPCMMHPVDKLHFIPELMNNNIGRITSKVVLSLATYGQDQRHRTVQRGEPCFTGEFYLPPLLQDERDSVHLRALALMTAWLMLCKDVPDELGMLLAPYGAMVEYIKSGSFNAKLHEQGKRSCKQAQQEIAEVSRQERKLVEEIVGSDSLVLSMYQPPCLETGVCVEGERYCGRDMRLRTPYEYFVHRLV